jgi:hypothetical protein
MLCGCLISGMLPYPLQIVSTAAFGEVVPCQDDGFGCEEPLLVLSEPDPNGSDREVFSSDGSNTAEVFDARSYRQATFRLAQRDEDLIGNWDQFVESVSLLTNAADSVHGIPLLITKVQFTPSPPDVRTFFMAAFAVETLFHRDITILSSPGFHLSVDPVDSIQLEVEGATVDVDPTGNTPVQFASAGEKTVRATVRFASGFIGENLFRVAVNIGESTTSQTAE